MPSGFTANLPSDILIDTAVLYAGGTGNAGLTGSAVVGVSRGGLSFNPNREWRNVEFDGRRTPMANLDRTVTTAPAIEGTMIEFGTSFWNTKLEPGSSINSGSITTITPESSSVMLSSSDYISNLRLVYKRGNGQYVQVRFPYSLCTSYDVKGGDNGEGEASVKFEARLSGSTDSSAYVIEYFNGSLSA